MKKAILLRGGGSFFAGLMAMLALCAALCAAPNTAWASADADNPTPLTLGAAQEASFRQGDTDVAYLYFTFTAPEAGWYVFSSSTEDSGTDPELEVYDANGSSLGASGDDGTSYNFFFPSFLEKNQTVFLRVEDFNYGISSSSKEFSITAAKLDPHDMRAFSISVTDFYIDESGVHYEVTVASNTSGVILKEGTDYTISFADAFGAPVDQEDLTAGEWYGVIATGKSPYFGSIEGSSCLVSALSLSRSSVEFSVSSPDETAPGSEDYWSTGKPVALTPTVIDGDGKTLAYGTDYELVYGVDKTDGRSDLPSAPQDPSKEGENYLVWAEGKGDYSDRTWPILFYILDAHDLQNADCSYVSHNTVISGADAGDIAFSVYMGATELVEGTHYKLKGYRNTDTGELATAFPAEAGEYAVVYEGISPYYGETETSFIVYDAKDLASALIVWNGSPDGLDSFAATGKPVVVETHVTTVDGTVLKEGVDYEVVYYDEHFNRLAAAPSEPGYYTAKCVAVPGGGCIGEAESFLSILDPYSFNDVVEVRFYPQCIYTGEPLEIEIEAINHLLDTVLVEGVDYEVSYSNNVGSVTGSTWATYQVTPKGQYKGTAWTGTFEIVPSYNLEDLTYYGRASFYLGLDGIFNERLAGGAGSEFLYTGDVIAPSVAYFGIDSPFIKQGVDYTLKYLDGSGKEVDPVEPGRYQILVQATEDGLCEGEALIDFEIIETVSMSTLGIGGVGVEIAPTSPHYDRLGSGEYDFLVPSEDVSWVLCPPSLWFDNELLAEGVDYTMDEPVWNAARGVYQVTFMGKGIYTGSYTISYRVAAAVDYGVENLPEDGWFANGAAVDGKIAIAANADGSVSLPTVSHGSRVFGIDYLVKGLVNSDGSAVSALASGTYAILVEGTGNYVGSSVLLPVEITGVPEVNDGAGSAAGNAGGSDNDALAAATGDTTLRVVAALGMLAAVAAIALAAVAIRRRKSERM